MISIIAAVGKNLELGYKGGLCFRIPEDLAYFKKVTLGHAIVMGSTTFESLPGALPGRENYVLSHSGQQFQGATTIGSLDEALALADKKDDEVFCIGGARVFEQFLPYAGRLYLTEIDAEAEADVYFPEFDKSEFDREVVGRGETRGVKYEFVIYTRRTV